MLSWEINAFDWFVSQGENVVKEIFPKKVAELNALLEVWSVFSGFVLHLSWKSDGMLA